MTTPEDVLPEVVESAPVNAVPVQFELEYAASVNALPESFVSTLLLESYSVTATVCVESTDMLPGLCVHAIEAKTPEAEVT